MTQRLLYLLGTTRGDLGLRLLAAALVACLLPFTLLVDGVQAANRRQQLGQVAAREWVTCPQGHRIALMSDGWLCGSCGATLPGHAFVPCPACGATAARVSCACGLTAHNPLFPRGR